MKKVIHLVGALSATLCILVFFTSTVLVEVFGSIEAVAKVKELVVFPGLFILVPSIAATGATGFALGKNRKGKLVKRKMKKMPVIALNGILILMPSAVYLNILASSGTFDTSFYIVQGVELIAGGINLVLMAMNMKDGLRMSGKLRPYNKANQSSS
ncbi:hypothetical protein [Psychromonas ossibalaenae]|uniref:hypothetical protein n=1 Tax=Psychromonas ossibalaenae TaxID=444922 RepID=UPI00036B8150|nr:hypothetical protein [Psychromonas ossibalaenae]